MKRAWLCCEVARDRVGAKMKVDLQRLDKKEGNCDRGLENIAVPGHCRSLSVQFLKAMVQLTPIGGRGFGKLSHISVVAATANTANFTIHVFESLLERGNTFARRLQT